MSSIADLTWDIESGNTSFDVEYKKGADLAWGTAPGSPTSLNTLNITVEEGILYNFRILGYCSTGPGGYTSLASISKCQDPVTLTATPGTSSVTLDWTNQPEHQSFTVEYKQNSSSTWITGVGSPVLNTNPVNNSLLISGLTGGVLYNFRVTTNCIDNTAIGKIVNATPNVVTTTSTTTSSTTTSSTSSTSTTSTSTSTTSSTSTTTIPVTTTSTSTTTSTTTTTLAIPLTGTLHMPVQNNITLGGATYLLDQSSTNGVSTNARYDYSPDVAKNGGTGTGDYIWDNSDVPTTNDLVPIVSYDFNLTSVTAGQTYFGRVYINGVLSGTASVTGSTGLSVPLSSTYYPQNGDTLLGVLSDT